MIEGRWPTDAELLHGEPVVVVSDITEKAYWPGRSAIGRTLQRKGKPFTVIGVVPAARQLALDLDPDGIIYYPMPISAFPVMETLFVRFSDRASVDVARVRQAIEQPQFSAYQYEAR